VDCFFYILLPSRVEKEKIKLELELVPLWFVFADNMCTFAMVPWQQNPGVLQVDEVHLVVQVLL
jgi:hypothetical protein